MVLQTLTRILARYNHKKTQEVAIATSPYLHKTNNAIYVEDNVINMYETYHLRFGFKSGICLLIAPVPVHCFSITFDTVIWTKYI